MIENMVKTSYFLEQKLTMKILSIVFAFSTFFCIINLVMMFTNVNKVANNIIFFQIALCTLNILLFTLSFLTLLFKKFYPIKVNDFSRKRRFYLSQFLPASIVWGFVFSSILFGYLHYFSFIFFGGFLLIGVILLLLMPDFMLKEDTGYTITINQKFVKVNKYEKNRYFKNKFLQKTSTYYRLETLTLKATEFLFDEEKLTIYIKNRPFYVTLKNIDEFVGFHEEILFLKSKQK